MVPWRVHLSLLVLSDVEICYLPADHHLFESVQILGSVYTVGKDTRCSSIRINSQFPFVFAVCIIRATVDQLLLFGYLSSFHCRLICINSFILSVPLTFRRQNHRPIVKDSIAACISTQAFRIWQRHLIKFLALITGDASVQHGSILLVELLLDLLAFVLWFG